MELTLELELELEIDELELGDEIAAEPKLDAVTELVLETDPGMEVDMD